MSRAPIWLSLLFACGRTDPADNVDRRGIDEVEVPTVSDASGGRTRSGTLVISEDLKRTFTVDADNGDILMFRHTDGVVTATHVGGEPTRLVRVGNTLFATLNQTGEIVKLRDTGDQLELLGRAAVGAEAYDVVAATEGPTLYVSLMMEDAVVAVDMDTLATTGRWATPGQPRWMTVKPTPEGDVLFVAAGRGAQVHELRPATGAVRSFALPQLPRFNRDDCVDHLLNRRITGEIAIDASTGKLYVPAWYADPVISQSGMRFMPETDILRNEGNGGGGGGAVADTGLSFDTGGGGGGGGGGFTPCDDPGGGNTLPPSEDSPYGVSIDTQNVAITARFNAALVELDTEGGRPAVFAVSSVRPTSVDDASPLVTRGLPTGIELIRDADGLRVVLALESTSSLVSVRPELPTEEILTGAFKTAARVGTLTAAGPSSPRFVDIDAGEVRTWSWIGRQLQTYSTWAVDPNAENVQRNPANVLAAPASQLDAAVLRGRELFFRSDLRQMAATGSGASCSGCHADGRDDGNTWYFSDFPRQTPSLAGDPDLTAPVTWTGEVDSVMREAHLTSQQRMGGTGVSFDEAADIAAYVKWSRFAVMPEVPAGLTATFELGRDVFRRPEVGCASCHAGPEGSSGMILPIFGLPNINVPGLLGIAATAPYFHDGSAPTLRAVLERARDGSMGNTSSLTEDEMVALETFLRYF